MSESILFDTDIVIDFLRGNKLAVSHFKSLSDKICFSVITVAEIYSGVKGKQEEDKIEKLFSAFQVIPVTHEISRQAGKIVKQYRPSHSVEIPDAIIAATCMALDMKLHTLNTKHYPMFADLNPPYSKQ